LPFTSFIQQTQSATYRDDTVAIIPLGAVETHGPHLPLGTDGLIAEGLLDHASAAHKGTSAVVRVPLVWLGASAEHADRAGTLSREPEDLIVEIVNIAEGLAKSGIRRVILFNGHGGNIAAASIAALKARTRFNMLAASAHWLDFGMPKDLVAPASVTGDVHGGWVETSVMLYLAPQLVGKQRAAAREATPPASMLFPEGPINWGWKLDDLANTAEGGWIGRPDLATVDLGKRMVEHAVHSLNALIDSLAAAPWPRV